MATEKSFSDVMQELRDAGKSGVIFINVEESTEELIKIYFKNGEIYHLSYGSATDAGCLDLIETFSWQNSTFFEGVYAPVDVRSSKFPTGKFIAMIKKTQKRVRVP